MIRSSGGTDSPAPATGSGASTRSGGARGFHILSQVHSESPTEILEAYTQAASSFCDELNDDLRVTMTP